MATNRYNPDRTPRAADWLALDEHERSRLIQQFHQSTGELAPDPDGHVLMHALVETQIAEGYEPAKRALARLRRAGLDRHEAVHALAATMLPVIAQCLDDSSTPAELSQRLALALDALTAESWRTMGETWAGDVAAPDAAADGPDFVMSRAGLSASELGQLDALLDKLPAPAMSLEMVDGFFCALISGPELVVPSEYLTEVWGPEPPFTSEAEFRTLFGLLMQHWNGIADDLLRTLSDPNHYYPPLMRQDGQGVAAGNDWAIGFVRGMDLRPESWEVLSQDEEQGGCLVPMLVLMHEHDPDASLRPKPITAELRQEIVMRMTAGLVTAYRYFEPMRRAEAMNVAQAQEPVRRAEPKVGRNDLCPCGSGRKYKRCCGAGPGSSTRH